MLELLMVMGILAVSSTFVIINFRGSQTTARDTQRLNDLKQYQTALEVYANRNSGNYWTSSGAVKVAETDLCTALSLTGTCPRDPKNGQTVCSGITCGYKYFGTELAFVLWGPLERNINGSYYIICSNGENGYSSSAPTSQVCPI